MTEIDVVAGILVRDGRVLLTQRTGHQDFAWNWECPGGKREQGETLEQTIGRELEEELGLADMIGASPVCAVQVANPEGTRLVRVSFLAVEYDNLLAFPPRPMEGQGMGWFTSREMRMLILAPGNAKAIDEIVKVIDGVRL